MSPRRTDPTPVGDLLGRTHDGQVELGRGTPGCRHCGHRATKYAGNGQALVHHPGADCCVDAVKDQIRWRTDDLEALRRATLADRDLLAEAERNAHDLVGRDAATATALAAKIRRANDTRLQARTEQANDLKAEIRDLEAALEVKTTGEAQRLPRPYAEA